MLQRLSHCQASSPSPVCNWVTFKWSQPPCSDFFSTKFYHYFLPKFFEKILGICVFLVLFYLENFDKFLILQSCKENPGNQCLFFSFLFSNFWCCSSNIYPNLAILRTWFLTIFFFQKQRICERIFLFQNIFHKLTKKNCHSKKSLPVLSLVVLSKILCTKNICCSCILISS
jgi:hypothetical protein